MDNRVWFGKVVWLNRAEDVDPNGETGETGDSGIAKPPLALNWAVMAGLE